MVGCCAVNCKNHSNNKELKGKVSFHDLPVIEELRAKWLRNISRANWEPREADKLCSSHFLQSDYRTGVKHRILLPDAIPTVFEGHPSYLIQYKSPVRKPPVERHPLSSKPKQIQVSNTRSTKNSEQNKDPATAVPSTKDVFTRNEVATRSVSTLTEPDKCDPTALRARHRELAKDLKLAMLRKQAKTQRQQILRLRSKLDTCEKNLDDLKQTADKARAFKYTEVVEKILQAAESKDLAAMLLKNQIDAFVRQRVAWSKPLLQQCTLWHNCSPRGYNYARKNRLLKLPNKSTLWRFLCSTQGKSVPSVIPQESIVKEQEPSTTQNQVAYMVISQEPVMTQTQDASMDPSQKLRVLQDTDTATVLMQELLVPQAQDASMALVQELIMPQGNIPSTALSEELIMSHCQELDGQLVQVWTTLCASAPEGLDNPENGTLGFVNSIEI